MATDATIDRDDGLREVLGLAQFLRLPEVKPPLEFLRGRVVQKVSPNLHHSLVGTLLPGRINEFARPRGLGIALVELRVTFGGESYVPDVSFFAPGRLPIDPHGRYGEAVRVPPDWSIEILSPGQTVAGLTARLGRLIRKGVRLGWLVQPRKGRVLVVRPGVDPEEIGPGATLSGEAVLPGFALPLDDLFSWLTPTRA